MKSFIIMLLPKDDSFQTKLLTWHDLNGRKNLPWQQNKTPYRVWLSEIMLQQTQVQTVIPYFNRFIARFPDINKLANATEDDVLYHWAGLGYYSRARNLLKTAKIIQEQYAGDFPNHIDHLMALPGIGRSTAGAILSIAFDIPTPILDGNVKRVLSRVFGIQRPIDEKITEEKLWTLAQRLTPRSRIAAYTQAIMDLGATLCKRTNTRCEICPFTTDCIAKKKNLVLVLPKKTKKKTMPCKDATYFILQTNDHLLLHKRPSLGIWGGLWSFPEVDGLLSDEEIKQYYKKLFKGTAGNFKKLEPLRHTFTHFHLTLHPIHVKVGKVKAAKIMTDGGQIWYKLGSPSPIGLPKPIQTLLKSISKKYHDSLCTLRKIKQKATRARKCPFTRGGW